MRVGYFHPFLTFGCFYRPPAAQSQSVHICDDVESMMLNNQHILSCGDFNIDMSDVNKLLSQTFHHFNTSHSLTQPISSPTRYGTSSATILDLFLTTPDIPIISSSVLQHSFSNYLPICLQIKCAVPSPPPSLVTHRSSKHFSKSSFEDDLSCVPWSIIDVFDDPDDKVEAFTSCFQMCLTATLHSRPSVSKKIPLHGSLRPSKKRWTDVIGSSGSITATHQLKHGTSSRPKGIVLFGFKGKPKMECFHQLLCTSHILLTSGTHSSCLLLPQLHLKIGHPLIQITHHPLPTLSTPTSPLSAPPFSTLTILHYRLHLFLTPHPHFLCTQQLLNGVRMLLLLSNQTALLGRIN